MERQIREYLLEQGAVAVGYAGRESFAGGPPSADLDYTLAGAKSAVSFALPLNKEKLRTFLSKKDLASHQQDNLEVNMKAKALSWEIADMLKREGYEAKGTPANLNYRKEIPGWQLSMPPKISHRYVAVAAGVGAFGWSGNVLVPGYGATVILGTCVTTAELEPTPPIPDSDNPCFNCKICVSACPVSMFERKESMSTSFGGRTFVHSARKNYLRCQFCCGGFTGLHESGKWSSWSPGRFKIPENENELMNEMFRAMRLYEKRPKIPGGYLNPAFDASEINLTCGNCAAVCWGDKKETAQNLKLLQNSGCVLQKPDGSLVAMPPDEAKKAFEAIPEEQRKLYQ
ncbi:MAG: epoxyqueuosine reductase [Desulfobacterales bacterium]|uniref:Epoxyqueuosine reductase n=1 Tax=Candidatus Desulfatibia vada TaxID=2841696 RepID=A0A8J6TUU1_9BACT|nr:epoxyqueuosine reductase [Candidatus Desulfatibia vada]MBL6972221.1 epoxyqueuosine reductase [Desulfobacterales bacterium]